ncbi:hypothetical protein DFJ73DRAFT_626806 [Zopfochytrium polystomum]|nr:hypothetical protein DFJ73DRAFT_626806 [Zopfochytrium polystomum]
MRVLISTKEAGIVIGQSGATVAEIRQHTSARVTVSDMVSGAHERVLTVAGPLDSVAMAFSMVATRIAEKLKPHDGPSTLTSRPISIRFLIPHVRMGSVIGRHGIKIKEIQELSGSRITASEELLPNSTERVVTVTGVIDAIHIASYHLGLVLLDHPERTTGLLYYKPIPEPSSSSRPPSSAASSVHSSAAESTHTTTLPPSSASAGDASKPKHVFIPNALVGAVIGKGGSRISEIRQASGCYIKIGEYGSSASIQEVLAAGGITSGGGRLLTITGSPEATKVALFMLQQRLEVEGKRHAPGSRRW